MIVASPQRQVRNTQANSPEPATRFTLGINRGFEMSHLARSAGSLALILILCAMPGGANRAEAQGSLWNNYQEWS